MVIIAEGPDNVGKGTQIRKLKEKYEKRGMSVHIIHYSQVELPPEYENSLMKKSKQYIASYSRYNDMLRLAETFATDKNTLIIFDRAHLGEYIYSPIYRHYEGDYVFKLEKRLSQEALDNIMEFVFIDTPENLISRDDGLSFSTDMKKKEIEVNRFIDAFSKSNFTKKHMVIVTNNDEPAVETIINNTLKEWNND